MKILFINISDIKGGAAKAVWRIANQLEKDYNTKNLFLVRDKHTTGTRSKMGILRDNVIPTRSNKFIYKLEWAINVFFNLIGLQYKFLPFSSRKILKTARAFNPDVISLNQIEGGYFQTRDMIKLSKIAPIVWTMHDLWAMTNNAHRLPDLKTTYPQVGIRWGNWLKRQKLRIYKKSNPYFVFPSQFIEYKFGLDGHYDNVIKNNAIKVWFNYRYEVIPHGVDITKFVPVDKPANGTPVILFVAEKLDKGGKLLWDILDELDPIIDFKVKIVLLGENDGKCTKKYKNIIIWSTGYIWDEDKLIEYYQAADLFLYPSSADVFGLVLIEAMACGLPVITTYVDAIPEVVGNAGILLNDYDYSKRVDRPIEFAYRIRDFCMGDMTAVKHRSRTKGAEYDIRVTAKRYYELFKEVTA